MAKRGLAFLAATVVAGGAVVGLARPVAATQVTIGSGPTACSSTGTVVPDFLGWGRDGWEEGGTLTEVGSCQAGATSPVIATGHWQRTGGARNPVTGECPPAFFELQDTRTNEWTDFWEMTDESTVVQSPQVIGANPFYVQVPFGTDVINVRVPAGGVSLAETDPAACAAWPTATNPPPTSFPTPPPFHIKFFGPPAGGSQPPTSLLKACLTVLGVLPR